MKKILITILSAAVLTLSGCGDNTSTENRTPDSTTTPAASLTEQTTSLTESTDNEQDSSSGVESAKPPVFDLETRTVRLNSGYDMPILGLGTYRLSAEQAENSVYHALADGYRLIDTANAYMNERAVGRGIKRAVDEGIVTRDEIFLTTKLWVSEYDHVSRSIDETLDRLGLEYIDLLLLHQPYGDYVGAYKELEAAVRDGRVHSIGLSNFYEKKFDEVIQSAEIMPAVLQNETHPYYQEQDLKNYIAKYGTVIEAWYPLGGRGNTQTLFDDPTISSIAKNHGKTSAQIILRWHLQAGNIAIPGSSNPDHILENCEIFDFELTDDEMKQMTDLDRNERFYNTSEEDEERMFTSYKMDFNSQQ